MISLCNYVALVFDIFIHHPRPQNSNVPKKAGRLYAKKRHGKGRKVIITRMYKCQANRQATLYLVDSFLTAQSRMH